MKYQVLFSLKNNEIFMNVVCCSCDWLNIVTSVMKFTGVFFFNLVGFLSDSLFENQPNLTKK